METNSNSNTSSTTSRAVFESLFRYKSRLVNTLAIVMGLVVLYVLFAPRQYRSEMNILVRNARPDYQITPERTNGSIPQSDVTEERINSEIEVLRSRDVADRVVDPTWSSSTTNSRTAAQIKQHEKAVTKLTKHLSIELLRKSDVIHVAYDTGDPQVATRTVEKLLEAFLLKQHELERSSGASSFFSGEQDRYKQELDSAERELAAYQQGHKIVSLPDKEAALEQQIVDLEQQLRTTEVQIGELSNRLTSGKQQLLGLQQREITQQKSVPNILAMEQLGTMLATYRNQRTTLLTKFLPTDRLVQEVDQQIANTSEALRVATEVNASEKSTDVNPVWQQLNTAASQNSIELSAAQARRSDQANQLGQLQAQLIAAEASTVDFNTLQAKVTELQGNYQLYTQKRNEAQIANAMDQQQLVNVAIAERPTFSATPSNPKIASTLAMGAFASLFCAVCVVFFSEMGRDTIASPSELESISAFPVLASVPFIEGSPLPTTVEVRMAPNPVTDPSSAASLRLQEKGARL
ncbi:GumC family protein [Granulicella arctica]|uniref:GumC family protein n=1 Tax=Granulicella arctica TaxID=940613 RepID=UPI0021DF9D21|nr:hypothetical protein [Granulicella arctica]